MAEMSRCTVCINFDIKKLNCEVHKDGIPRDVFVELEECKHFQKRKSIYDPDLPVAKGR